MPETAHVISLKLANPDSTQLGWGQIDVIHLYNDVTKDLVALCRVEGSRLTEINWKELVLEIERGHYVEIVEEDSEEAKQELEEDEDEEDDPVLGMANEAASFASYDGDDDSL